MTSVEPSREPHAPSRRPLAIALTAVGVLLAVVAFLLLRPSDEAAPSTAPSRTAVATTTPATGSTGGDGVLPAPAVVATPQVGAVEFSWSYSGAKTTDTFRVHLGPNVQDAQIADPVTLAKATYTVKVARGTPACLIATVVRGGQTSPASEPVCGAAR